MSTKDDLLFRLASSRKALAWGSPGPAASDFRTESMTRPSVGMLLAAIETTLGDDVFREDTTTTQFEHEIARLLGKEDGCLAVTGTMANQLGIRALLHQVPPYAVLCDAKAHLFNLEGGGPAMMCGALVQPVFPRNRKYLTIADIDRQAVVSDDVHKCPTRVISLENTCAGMIVPLDELKKISEWAKRNQVQIHLDGARLWEAVAAGGASLHAYCSLVDCVTVDFTKGLAAPMGSMVLGDAEVIRQVRRLRKSIGGGMRQAGVVSAMAWAALKENWGDGNSAGSKMREVHHTAKQVEAMWASRGGKVLHSTESNQIWLDLNAAGVDPGEFNRIGPRKALIVLSVLQTSLFISNSDFYDEQTASDRLHIDKRLVHIKVQHGHQTISYYAGPAYQPTGSFGGRDRSPSFNYSGSGGRGGSRGSSYQDAGRGGAGNPAVKSSNIKGVRGDSHRIHKPGQDEKPAGLSRNQKRRQARHFKDTKKLIEGLRAEGHAISEAIEERFLQPFGTRNQTVPGQGNPRSWAENVRIFGQRQDGGVNLAMREAFQEPDRRLQEISAYNAGRGLYENVAAAHLQGEIRQPSHLYEGGNLALEGFESGTLGGNLSYQVPSAVQTPAGIPGRGVTSMTPQLSNLSIESLGMQTPVARRVANLPRMHWGPPSSIPDLLTGNDDDGGGEGRPVQQALIPQAMTVQNLLPDNDLDIDRPLSPISFSDVDEEGNKVRRVI
ncbi:MAG: hypothetical protein Q9203_002209 [Teloschistes exilis]